MKMMQRFLGIVGIGLLVLFSVSPNAFAESPNDNDIVVFVNKGASVKTVTVAELRQLFLKQKTSWTSGGSVVCINAPRGTALRDQFRKQVLAMSAAEESTHWETARIRSQVSPPAEMLNTPKAVFRIKNALSYAFRKDVPKDVVKIVLEISK